MVLFLRQVLRSVGQSPLSSLATPFRGAVAVSVRSFASDIDRSKLTVTRTAAPKTKPPHDSLVFGHTFTDHMLEIEWNADKGWDAPRIVPYHNLSLDPSAQVFHYAGEIFEGMKAYVAEDKSIRMFRPDKNMDRFWNSAERMCLPTFDKKNLLECIQELVRVDRDWIPNKAGYSLYIRPTLISTAAWLGVGPSSSALFYCILSPVGPYYKTGFAPVDLFATTKYVRAWPGGTGAAKCGGNYAPGIKPALEAAKEGYQQILWLYGDDDQVTEVGTMNMFVFWKNEQGEKELITAPLDDGTILPGVTRDSILNLAKDWGKFKVTQRTFTMPEVVKAVNENRLIEAFGAGTAAIVCPIKKINYKGVDYDIPLDASNPDAKIGALTKKFADTIMGIQYGQIKHDWSVVVDK